LLDLDGAEVVEMKEWIEEDPGTSRPPRILVAISVLPDTATTNRAALSTSSAALDGEGSHGLLQSRPSVALGSLLRIPFSEEHPYLTNAGLKFHRISKAVARLGDVLQQRIQALSTTEAHALKTLLKASPPEQQWISNVGLDMAQIPRHGHQAGREVLRHLLLHNFGQDSARCADGFWRYDGHAGESGFQGSHSRLQPGSASLLQELWKHGVVHIRQLLPPHRMAKLAQAAQAALDRAAMMGSELVVKAEEALQAGGDELFMVLSNATLTRTLNAYTGGDAILAQVTLLRLGASLNGTSSYVSGLWHHDACGQRLKLMLFLHDIAEDGRPTVVARGSHRLLYYSQHHTRVSQEFVSRTYREGIQPLVGSRGDAYLFDTNMLHRGNAAQGNRRDVIILEYASLRKYKGMNDCGMPYGPVRIARLSEKLSNASNQIAALIHSKYVHFDGQELVYGDKDSGRAYATQ